MPIKAVNTLARYIRSTLKIWVSFYLWMVKAGLQTASTLSSSGEEPKCERIYLNAYQSIGELITDVGDYIEFYNHRRFH
jgi:hypothetical protein